jgi:hypothetical protein
MGNTSCYMQMIGTKNFLMLNSQTYCVLMFDQLLNVCHVRELILGNRWRKSWNNYPLTFIVQDCVSNGSQRCLCSTRRCSMPLCLPNICADLIRGKRIPRVNSDLWQDVGALLDFRFKAVQHGMTSEGTSTTRKFKTQLARSWQVCCGIQKEWFMLIFFHMV